MQEHVIEIRLTVQARNSISRADIEADLRKQLTVIQEQAPYRHSDGAGWWTNDRNAVQISGRYA